MNRLDPTPRSFSSDRLHAALRDVGGPARADYLDDIVAQAGRTRQRPAWTHLERWLSVDIAVPSQGVPRVVVVVGALAVLVTLLAGMVYVGAIRLQPERPPVVSRETFEPAASPTSTTSPSLLVPPPLTERFDSALHGISVSYPAGWRTKPATQRWVHGPLAFDSSEVDVIFDPALQDAVYMAIVSEPLDGQRPDDWCCSPSVEYPDVCEPGSGGHGAGTSTLDGAKAFYVQSGCIRHGRWGDRHAIFAATATRGYIVTLYVLDASLGTNYDRDWFMSVLETVELRPENAR